MTNPKLTKTIIENAPIRDTEYVTWDSMVPGFGVRIRPSGKRTYIFKYRLLSGRQRKMTIGQHGPLTVDQARTVARKLALEVSQGFDPAGQRAAQRTAPTMADLCSRYMQEHALTRKKASSAAGDAQLIANYVLPRFERQQVREVTREHIHDLHHSMRGTPYQANRVLALLSKMFNLAEVWGMRPDSTNPCRHVSRYKEDKHERFLSAAELAKLGEALTNAEAEGQISSSAAAAVRLLILTGCRLREILTLRWDYVDFEQGCLRLPDSKTGRKIVQVGAPALRVLNELPRTEGNPFVITGKRKGCNLINLEKPWRRVRALAGLPDVRLHDLRHTYASFGVAANMSLPLIGKLLGHQQASTTQRYAHLDADPVKAGATIIANGLDAALRGQAGEVIPLVKGRGGAT